MMAAKPERRQQAVAARLTDEAQPPAREPRSATVDNGVPSGDLAGHDRHDRERQATHFCGGGPQPSDAFYRRNTTEPNADGDTEKQASLRWTPAELMRLGAAIAAEADTRGEALPEAQRWEAELQRIRAEREPPHEPTSTVA
jgi:hypothetical protein